ncbi:MAG: ABC transporter ATP-binding protein [Candidatus Aminicenantales bacterium]|jgi:molybdopterin-binding protein
MRIEALEIGKKAGGHVLLRGVSLDIPAGGVSVIIGPNGAGKTTLLKILGMLDQPSSGRMAYDGRPAGGLNARERTALRRRLGFVFQHPLLLNGTALANMRQALALRKRPFEAEKVEAALGAVGLAGKQGLDVGVLSGGEKQRLQLARAMLLDPEVLLADEPTSNLDPLSARFIEDQLLALARAGKTVILATHNLVEARLLGGHLFFLKDGEIVQSGTPGQVLQNPATLDVAHFASTTNVLNGRLMRTGEDACLEVGGMAIHVVSALDPGPVTAVLRPEDILLSRDPFRSSARNVLSGRVEAVDDLGLVVLVRVRCGELLLGAAITRTSLQDLGLGPGETAVLTFKASAVLVFPAD